MRVKALTAFSLGQGKDVAAGDVFDLEVVNANTKILAGWVEQVPETTPIKIAPPFKKPRAGAAASAQPAAAAARAGVATRDPEPTHRDPQK